MGRMAGKTFTLDNRLVPGVCFCNTLLVAGSADLLGWNGEGTIAVFLVTGSALSFLHRCMDMLFKETWIVAAMGRVAKDTVFYTLISLVSI